MTSRAIYLRFLPDDLALLSLPSSAPVPAWVDLDAAPVFLARTATELALVLPDERVPAEQEARRGWRGIVSDSPVPFEEVGIISRISGALADAGVPILTIGTFGTDLFLIRAEHMGSARAALKSKGLQLRDD